MPNQLAKSLHEIAKQNRRPPGPTNADLIRAMSDEELAVLLDSFRCGNCMRRGNNCFPGSLEDWLRQPAEGDAK
jgi:hypothetical protein